MKKVILSALTLGVLMTSCKKEGCTDASASNFNPDAKKDDNSCVYDEENTVPTTYNFTNVDINGQIVRLNLLKDLTAKMAEAATGTVTAQELLDIYENTSGAYSEIATDKNLSGKTEANADVAVRAWFDEIETISSTVGGYTTANNEDLKQMVEKTLMGAVFFNQAIDYYLVEVLSDDNSTVTAGKGTDMENHWDEAFGYFGAALDYNNYTDDEIKTTGNYDSNGDGNIDLASEQCYYYAITAAKRDAGTSDLGATDQTNFTKALFDAWLKGRHAISNGDYTSRDEAIAAIQLNWQKIIAATAVHYINYFTSDVNNSGSDEDKAKHYAEMKYYFKMLSYYPDNAMGANYNTVLTSFGDYPADAAANLSGLASSRDLIQTAYGFTDNQVAAW